MNFRTVDVQSEIQPLNKQEIDRRIQDLVDHVASRAEVVGAEELAPRWIRSGELVRRMRPYLSSN